MALLTLTLQVACVAMTRPLLDRYTSSREDRRRLSQIGRSLLHDATVVTTTTPPEMLLVERYEEEHANIMPNGSFVHYQGAIDGPNCCTQLPAAWRNRTAYKTPRSAFEKGNCFATCDQNPDCPAASAKWMPGSCKNATSGPGGSHPRSKFTVKHGSCTNKPDSDCCTNWCTF